MKKLLTAAALIALAGTPAFAQTANNVSYVSGAYSAGPGDVVFGGNIVGRDPDPNIRLGILKQAETGSP